VKKGRRGRPFFTYRKTFDRKKEGEGQGKGKERESGTIGGKEHTGTGPPKKKENKCNWGMGETKRKKDGTPWAKRFENPKRGKSIVEKSLSLANDW